MANSKPKHSKIVAHDINEWATKLTEAIAGVKVPADLVEQEIAKIAAERAAAARVDKAGAKALSSKERAKTAKKAPKTHGS